MAHYRSPGTGRRWRPWRIRRIRRLTPFMTRAGVVAVPSSRNSATAPAARTPAAVIVGNVHAVRAGAGELAVSSPDAVEVACRAVSWRYHVLLGRITSPSREQADPLPHLVQSDSEVQRSVTTYYAFDGPPLRRSRGRRADDGSPTCDAAPNSKPLSARHGLYPLLQHCRDGAVEHFPEPFVDQFWLPQLLFGKKPIARGCRYHVLGRMMAMSCTHVR